MASDLGHGIILFIIGIVLIKYGLDGYLMMQKMRNTPTSKVRSAAVGLVELSGRPASDAEYTSPITKTKCVFWHLVCGYVQSHGRSAEWRTIYERKSPPPLYLEDDTGRMPIDTSKADVAIKPRFQSHGSLEGLDPEVIAFLKENQDVEKIFSRYRSKNMSVREFYLTENDPLYVMGTAIPQKTVSAVAHENLIISRGRDNVLFISDSSEKKLEGQTAFWSVALIGGGILFSCIGILLIF